MLFRLSSRRKNPAQQYVVMIVPSLNQDKKVKMVELCKGSQEYRQTDSFGEAESGRRKYDIIW